MIDRTIIAEAARLLLAAQLSQRQIAAQLGISRGTVLAISRRRRPLDLQRKPHPTHASSKQERRRSERVTLRAAQLAERCPECRNLVLLPCQACKSRKQKLRFTG